MVRLNQCQRVLRWMEDFGSITTYDAFNELDITRLPSRICDLRKDGYPIGGKTETRKNRYGETKHYKRYYIEKEKA